MPPAPRDVVAAPRDVVAAPRDVVAAPPTRKRATVGWCGGKTRRIEFVRDPGHRDEGGDGLVPIRWASVHDSGGTREGRHVDGTGPTRSPLSRIVTRYTTRRGIEVTAAEARCHPAGFDTPRNWSRRDRVPPADRAVPAGAVHPRLPDLPPAHA